MPRPKVLPANRLRANTACTACRASKKRCSGTFPCSNCLHKGRGRTCIPFKAESDTRQRNHPTPVSRPVGDSGPTWDDSADTVRIQSPTVSHDTSRFPYPDPQALEAGSRSPEATHRTHPRMLRNLQGERVYVGKAASLSFLQLLRETVSQHIGPSQFSHNVKSEDMLETEAQHDTLNFAEERCDADEKRRFIQNYHAAISGFLNIGSSIDTALADATLPKTDREKTRAAIGDLMTAIGAQSCPDDPGSLQAERFFLARGQSRTFANMLEDPSMDLVRVFLLMSFYMLGACRRNAAFMYLGVAARAAVALGLHADSSESVSRTEQQERSRVWMSLCVLDLLVSSILGRPSATSSLLSENRREAPPTAPTPMETRLIASYRLALILDEIIGRLYSEKAASIETADMLLAKLNRWSTCLPDSLRTTSLENDDNGFTQEHVIGNLHVACSYHFAVILVTRPFLISALSIRLARLHQSLSAGVPGEPLEQDPAHSRLASACIDSAVYMLQTCLEVHQSGLLLRNMRILKAFVFAAALVLGFSMFSHREVDTEVDGAFSSALAVLRMLSQQSAQAAHYLEILTLLEAAVTQQRQRLAAQARQRRSQYVNRIFSLSENLATPRASSEADSQADSSTPPLLAQGGSLYPWITLDDNTTMTPPIVDAFPDWEGMELPLWDSFPFLTEPSVTL